MRYKSDELARHIAVQRDATDIFGFRIALKTQDENEDKGTWVYLTKEQALRMCSQILDEIAKDERR